MRVDRRETICIANVDFGEQRSTAFLHDEIDGVIHAGVGLREVVALDAVIDTTPKGEGRVYDQPPFSGTAMLWNDTETVSV